MTFHAVIFHLSVLVSHHEGLTLILPFLPLSTSFSIPVPPIFPLVSLPRPFSFFSWLSRLLLKQNPNAAGRVYVKIFLGMWVHFFWVGKLSSSLVGWGSEVPSWDWIYKWSWTSLMKDCKASLKKPTVAYRSGVLFLWLLLSLASRNDSLYML